LNAVQDVASPTTNPLKPMAMCPLAEIYFGIWPKEKNTASQLGNMMSQHERMA